MFAVEGTKSERAGNTRIFETSVFVALWRGGRSPDFPESLLSMCLVTHEARDTRSLTLTWKLHNRRYHWRAKATASVVSKRAECWQCQTPATPSRITATRTGRHGSWKRGREMQSIVIWKRQGTGEGPMGFCTCLQGLVCRCQNR